MERRLRKVKTTMSIHAHRRTLELLDGEYASIHHGRSHDFDDLREYVAGDDVRDIDWKASARHGSMLIKRYVAERHFSLVVIMPAGREMAATAAGGEPKRDIAVLAAGVLGWLAVRHGDDVSMISGGPGRIHATRARNSEAHLEHVLQETIALSQPDSPPSDLPGLLRHVSRNVRGRKVLLIIADDGVEPREVEDLLRSLRLRHEVLWVDVADLDPLGVAEDTLVRDVAADHTLPDLLATDRLLAEEFGRSETTRRADVETMLRRTDVSSARAGPTDEVVPMIVRMLEKRRRGR